MKMLDCPLLGPRPQSEFRYGGTDRPMPDPHASTDTQWADWVFNRDNAPGIRTEWWLHVPTGMWFVARRDTVADTFLDIVAAREAMHG